MIHREGAIVLGVVAALFVAAFFIARSGAPCARYETREVEMISQGKTGGGARKHQFRVCVERVPTK
jgi:hypothetical protein